MFLIPIEACPKKINYYSKKTQALRTGITHLILTYLLIINFKFSIDELLSEMTAREKILEKHEAMIKNLLIEKKHLIGSLNKIEDSYKAGLYIVLA